MIPWVSFNIYLFCLFIFFIFLAASGLSCGMQDLLFQCAGLSLVVACRFSLSNCGVWAQECLGLVVCGTWALYLRRASSVVVACGLSCPVACGILVPQLRIEPASPAFEGGFSTTGPPGKSLWFPIFAKNTQAVIMFPSLCFSHLISIYHTTSVVHRHFLWDPCTGNFTFLRLCKSPAYAN